MKIRFVVLLLLGLAFAYSIYSANFTSVKQDWLVADPERKAAVEAAQRGQGEAWYDWLLAHEHLRATAAAAVLDRTMAQYSSGNLAAIHAERALQLPFRELSLGSSERFAQFEAMLFNSIAYTLVGYTATPTADDLKIAESLLPRLEAVVSATPNSAFLDTIGCIHFLAGRREQARTAFSQAVACIPTELERAEKDEERAELRRGEDLFRRRLAACDDPEAELPREAGVAKPPDASDPAETPAVEE